MAKAKLNSLIDFNGEIITLQELDNRGLLEYKEDEFNTTRTARGIVKKYCAYIKGTNEYYEITKALYLSKTNQEMNFKSERLITKTGLIITDNAINAYNNSVDVRGANYKERKELGGIEANEYLYKVDCYFRKNNYSDNIKLTRQDIEYYIINIEKNSNVIN